MPRFHFKDQWLIGMLWPCGMAEQCSRHQKEGVHCLSVANLRTVGVGELRRAAEGPRHGQHGFGYFCRSKSGSSAGAKPDNSHQINKLRRATENTLRVSPTKTFMTVSGKIMSPTLHPPTERIALKGHKPLSSTTIYGWPAILFGAVFVIMGSPILAIGMEWMDYLQSSIHAPLWVIGIWGDSLSLVELGL